MQFSVFDQRILVLLVEASNNFELCPTKRGGEGGREGVGDIKLSMADKFAVCESFGCGGGASRGAIIADIFVNQPCLLNTFQ